MEREKKSNSRRSSILKKQDRPDTTVFSEGADGLPEDTRTVTQFTRRVSFAQQTFVRHFNPCPSWSLSGSDESTNSSSSNVSHDVSHDVTCDHEDSPDEVFYGNSATNLYAAHNEENQVPTPSPDGNISFCGNTSYNGNTSYSGNTSFHDDHDPPQQVEDNCRDKPFFLSQKKYSNLDDLFAAVKKKSPAVVGCDSNPVDSRQYHNSSVCVEEPSLDDMEMTSDLSHHNTNNISQSAVARLPLATIPNTLSDLTMEKENITDGNRLRFNPVIERLQQQNATIMNRSGFDMDVTANISIMPSPQQANPPRHGYTDLRQVKGPVSSDISVASLKKLVVEPSVSDSEHGCQATRIFSENEASMEVTKNFDNLPTRSTVANPVFDVSSSMAATQVFDSMDMTEDIVRAGEKSCFEAPRISDASMEVTKNVDLSNLVDSSNNHMLRGESNTMMMNMTENVVKAVNNTNLDATKMSDASMEITRNVNVPQPVPISMNNQDARTNMDRSANLSSLSSNGSQMTCMFGKDVGMELTRNISQQNVPKESRTLSTLETTGGSSINMEMTQNVTSKREDEVTKNLTKEMDMTKNISREITNAKEKDDLDGEVSFKVSDDVRALDDSTTNATKVNKQNEACMDMTNNVTSTLLSTSNVSRGKDSDDGVPSLQDCGAENKSYCSRGDISTTNQTLTLDNSSHSKESPTGSLSSVDPTPEVTSQHDGVDANVSSAPSVYEDDLDGSLNASRGIADFLSSPCKDDSLQITADLSAYISSKPANYLLGKRKIFDTADVLKLDPSSAPQIKRRSVSTAGGDNLRRSLSRLSVGVPSRNTVTLGSSKTATTNRDSGGDEHVAKSLGADGTPPAADSGMSTSSHSVQDSDSRLEGNADSLSQESGPISQTFGQSSSKTPDSTIANGPSHQTMVTPRRSERLEIEVTPCEGQNLLNRTADQGERSGMFTPRRSRVTPLSGRKSSSRIPIKTPVKDSQSAVAGGELTPLSAIPRHLENSRVMDADSPTLDLSGNLSAEEMPEMPSFDEELFSNISAFVSSSQACREKETFTFESLCDALDIQFDSTPAMELPKEPSFLCGKPATLQSQLQCRVFHQPQLSCLQDYIQVVRQESERWRGDIENKMTRLNQSPPKWIETLMEAQRTGQDISEMKKEAQAAAKTASMMAQTWFNKLQTDNILKCVEAREEAYKQVKIEVEEMMKAAEPLKSMNDELDQYIEEIKRMNQEKEEADEELSFIQSDVDSLHASCEVEAQRLKELEVSNREVSRGLEVCGADTDRLEEEVSWMNSLTEWSLLKQTREEMQFGFLYNTVSLCVRMSSHEDTEARRITSVSCRSRMADTSKPWAKLCHHLVMSRVDCGGLQAKYREYRHISQLLSDVSHIVCKARHLSKDLRILHSKHELNIETNSVSVIVRDRETHRKVKLTSTFDPWPDRLSWRVTPLTGLWKFSGINSVENLQSFVEQVPGGYNYISSVVETVQKFLTSIRR